MDRIEADPGDAEDHFILATSLGMKNDLEGAIANYRKFLEIEPDHVVALKCLAKALYMTEDYQGSIDQLRRSLVIKPDQPDIYDGGRTLYYKMPQQNDKTLNPAAESGGIKDIT